MIGDIVPDDGPFMMDGTQHASEEELRISQNTNGDYDKATLKPLGHVTIDFAIQNIFICKWTLPDREHRDIKLTLLMAQGSRKYSFIKASTWPGADCGIDHKLLR